MKLFRIQFSVLILLFSSLVFNQSCTVNKIAQHNSITRVKPSKDSVIRILAIGNSFSDDAIEHYLYDLAKAGGYKVIIGNLYVPGAPLDLHVKNAKGDKGAYSYRKIGLNGDKKVTAKTSISAALADENWNYISFQQGSPKSGLFESYEESLPDLIRYVKERASNPQVKFILHQTWAYAQNSTHKAFPTYNSNQMVMYKAIVGTSKKVMATFPIDILVPAGTAIQNARTKLGDVLCRDGYHLDLNIGRYTAASTWYETIFMQNVKGISYKPAKVSEEEAKVGREAAHNAVVNPYQVTKIK